MFNRYIIYTWVLLCDYVKLLNELTVHHHSMNFQRGGTHLAQLLKDSFPIRRQLFQGIYLQLWK